MSDDESTIDLRSAGGLRHAPAIATCLAIAAAAATAASLKWLPWPWVGIALVWAAVLVVAIFLAPSSSWKAFWFNLAFLAAMFAGVEAFLEIKHSRSNHPSAKHRFEYQDDYSTFHESLGFAPTKGLRSRSRRFIDDDLIYDVHYTIDDRGLRLSPPQDRATHSILFFGGSFTFGEGVSDEQAFPFLVGKLAGGRVEVRNFGFHAYGPHQMLAAIEDGIVEMAVTNEPSAVVYLAIHDHVARVSGRRLYGKDGPRYELAAQGGVERLGRFRDTEAEGVLRGQLRKSYLLKRLLDWSRARRSTDYDLFVEVVVASRDDLLELFPGIEFHTILWATGDRLERVAEPLRQRGIEVHLSEAVIPDLERRRTQYLLADGHPNALAHEKIAQFVFDAIVSR